MYKKNPRLASYNDCTGCMLCANVCGKAAIQFHIDANGFWSPVVDPNKCVGCLLCEINCNQVRNIPLGNQSHNPMKGFAKNAEIRKKSTSGGIFYVLASHAIKKNEAVVFGAVCVNNEIRHIGVDHITDLTKLQGSKYAQSNTANVYVNAKRLLDEGCYVVFSGTPCQIAALNVYLKKEYAKLLTIDIICHGVPSYKLVERHLAINNGEQIVQFRTKRLGWGYDSHITYSRGGDIVTTPPGEKNLFYHAFQSELCFRISCYKCHFNTLKRCSDITIGDYWAARFSEDYNPLGISTILPNTKKGVDFVSNCPGLHIEGASWEKTLKFNPRLFSNRKGYIKLSLSDHIGHIYKYLPNRIADYIIEAWHSKRRHLFYIWSFYIRWRRKYIDRQSYGNYQDIINELNQLNQ